MRKVLPIRRKAEGPPSGAKAPSAFCGALQTGTAALLLSLFPAMMQAQATDAMTPAQNQPASAAAQGTNGKKEKLPSAGARRKAARLYMEASKLYMASQFDQALSEYQQAAQLDPTNTQYQMAVEVARSHTVTALIQQATKDRMTGNTAGARAALERALTLDPKNPEVTQHLYELADDVVRNQSEPLYPQGSAGIGEVEPLLSAPGRHSFHLNAGAQQVIQQVFRDFGLVAMLDNSVSGQRVRLDLDNADFATATRALNLVTDTFFVPLDAHRVLVARDTRENRQQFMHQAVETVRLPGLSSDQLTQAGNLARNVFGIDQVATNANNSSLTLHGAPSSLEAFNANIQDLMAGSAQVVVDVRVIQIGHTSEHNMGVQPPQSINAFNLYAEEQSILKANQALVQQIISSGLASANDPLAILGILLASGQVSSSLLTNGFATFGGGLAQSAISPNGPATLHFSLNSSDSRALDHIQLRLGDGEAGSLKEGTRYPIQLASYTGTGSGLNIPGLTGAGNSSSLGSLLSSLTGAVPTVPMIQYQDLGLTLKITPKILRNDDVALTVDLQISALSGSSLNGDPILNNQAFSGVVTLKRGETAELASELTQSESRAISGSPGLNQIPGLNDIQNHNLQKNYATLLLVMTPHVVRTTQPAGHTPPMVLEKTGMQ